MAVRCGLYGSCFRCEPAASRRFDSSAALPATSAHVPAALSAVQPLGTRLPPPNHPASPQHDPPWPDAKPQPGTEPERQPRPRARVAATLPQLRAPEPPARLHNPPEMLPRQLRNQHKPRSRRPADPRESIPAANQHPRVQAETVQTLQVRILIRPKIPCKYCKYARINESL